MQISDRPSFSRGWGRYEEEPGKDCKLWRKKRLGGGKRKRIYHYGA